MRAALSVGVGLTVGIVPVYGVHIFIVLAICVPLRLDAALAYLAANISMPVVAPFLLLAEVEIGAVVRTGHAIAMRAADAKRLAFGELATELAIGSAILAPTVGVVGGAIAWGIASRARGKAGWGATTTTRAEPAPGNREPLALSPAIERVAARFAPGRRASFHYVRSKLASDPVAASVAALAPLGEVADIGCGRGQLAALLLEATCATRVYGVDWDARKVDDARAACEGLDARFESGDVRTVDVPRADTVLLIDVIHYLGDAEQDALVARAADSARERVLIRELDPERGWRSAVTLAQEKLTTGLAFNRGARVNARPIARVTEVLEARGFEVRVEPCWGGTPFSNVLIVATRVATSRA